MSNRRSIAILLFLLAAAVGANLWLDLARFSGGEVVRRAVLAPDADRAVAFEISRADGSRLRLAKSDGWRIERPFAAEADRSVLTRLVDALAFTPVVDSLDDDEALRLGRTRADFGLDLPALTLTCHFPGRTVAVSFGDRTKSGEGYYAAVADVDSVFIVPDAVYAAAAQSADAWRRRAVFRCAPDEVQSIDIRRGEAGSVRLERRGERWEVTEPRRAPASMPAVKRIVDSVLSCQARRFVWPVGTTNEAATASVALLTGYGLDPETCQSVVFRTADGRDHRISFGSAAGAGDVYALIHGGSAVATVAAAAKASVTLDAGALVEGRLFPVEKDAIRRISIIDGDVSYLLALDDNGAWRLDSPVSAAADPKAVASLLDKLLVMRTADLEEGGVKVSLAADTPAVEVAKEAFLGADGFESLRSKTVLEIDPATVKRLVLVKAGAEKGESVVYDPDRKGWNVETSARPAAIDQARLAAFLAALSPLKAKAVARLKVAPGEMVRYGLEKPSCTIAVDRLLEDSVRRNILLGAAVDSSGDVYATVGSTDAVFILDAKTVAVLKAGVLGE